MPMEFSLPVKSTSPAPRKITIDLDILMRGYELMVTAKELAVLYETNKEITAKYVHATSRGHEAVQLALAMQLRPQDFVSPYYRDDSILLGIGCTSYELLLHILARRDEPFTGGRHYYGHPSLRRDDQPKIIFQSSSTGMQAIPTTGIAHGLKYRERTGLNRYASVEDTPVVVCSLGDGALTEGEVSEALQSAALYNLPILFLVQDNGWDISATARETRTVDAADYVKGLPRIEAVRINGSDFIESWDVLGSVLQTIRKERRPFLVHAKVPLLNHHTSGVRMEWYRTPEELAEARSRDPLPLLQKELLRIGIPAELLDSMEQDVRSRIQEEYQRALQEPDPDPTSLFDHVLAPTTVTEERGTRVPADGKEVVMVDAALHAIDELFREYPEALLYGQDVGGELGGVFREAATLTKKYGADRVFNTAIQEAYIIGSTVGMSAVGNKPIVEVQFADYIWPGVNQLFSELSRSCYLSMGKWPVQSLIRVPIGAYGSGGPYHSSSVESAILTIKGIKVAYPSNAADMKGLMKAAFLDPNPVVMFEHKGLYWGKVPGSKEARCIEPDSDYVVPLGKARIYLEADADAVENGESCLVITYGMGVHWARNAAKEFPGRVEVLDLRSLEPIDWDMITGRVAVHGKVLCLTEEQLRNSFCESLAGRIAEQCFTQLDAPVMCMGAENAPAIPLNSILEATMLPNAEKVAAKLKELLEW